MRLIDADALKDKQFGAFGWLAGEDLTAAPTIDAVPVVRCRECKHYDGKWLCKISGVPSRKPDDFCSYGKRKEGAD